ncbi:MAG: FAD-dependent oxidoreductase [Thermodesulfobacteriota bacterium]|nr:FAD-dependent oxidoreductase [Thermodesulfobacteriota bacterium]
MSSFDYDIAIIGGGAAGLTITAGAAQLGARTLLIEKESALGGDCLHYGCVPSKTLIKTAHVYHQIKQAEQFGLPAADIGPVNYRDVAARIQDVIAKIQVHDSVERFCGLGAQVEFGAPEFRDEHAAQLNGKTISAKQWVIATGSSPAPPRLDALNNISYLTNKEIFSLDELPASMIVLGAGPIAMEMAQAFNRLGTRVQVVQRSGQILSKEDKDMADTVMAAMEEEGVEFFLNATLVDARQTGSNKEIIIEDKEGNTTTLQADSVLLAQGRTPNLEGLGLDHIGLEYNRRGIPVDHRMRTNHKHIFAAGDINGTFQFTHAAGYEGGIVVSNAIFHLPRKANYTWMPWCTYTDPELASIGMNEKAARQAGIEYQVWSEPFSGNDRALAEGSFAGKIKMLLNEKEKPVGIQIAGPRAGDLIGEWVAILGGGVKLSTMAGAVHPYPTLAEINKRVAGSYLSPKIFSDRIKKGLKLVFQLKGPVDPPCSQI